MRTDTLRRSAPIYGTFVLAGALVIHGVGLLGGASFRLTALSLWPYLAWGLAQQFALQNLLAGNLAALLSPAWPSAMLAALLFAAAHVPRFALAGVAFVGGFAFVLLYRRFPNLYAAGAAHGVLGWLLFGCLGWS